MSAKRKSIEPTYDSRETGPRFHVTTRIDDRTIGFHQPIPDPFVRQTVRVGWPDLLRGLLLRRLTVEVIVDGDRDVVNDVLELDANTLIPNSTRRDEFNGSLRDAMKLHVAGLDEQS
jgi:hypothetical protein